MKVGKYYTVVLEGIDKTGKDQLARYIDKYCGHTMCIPRRGIVSNIAYAKLYGRETPEYEVENHKHELYVLLRADKEDWKMRCHLTNEPPIDYEKNVEVFEDTWKWLKTTGIPCIEFNTTEETPHNIALKIIEKINSLNNDN